MLWPSKSMVEMLAAMHAIGVEEGGGDAGVSAADLFAIQSELAESIVAQLEAKLSPQQKAEIEQRGMLNVKTTRFDGVLGLK